MISFKEGRPKKADNFIGGVNILSLLQTPGDSYRNEFLKGRLYRCPAHIPSNSIIIVRPLHDGKSTETIPANIIPLSQCQNAFDHTPYQDLKLKSDEELVVSKVKKRRVIALTRPDNYGLIKVSPLYTLKKYHENIFDLKKLKDNHLAGIIYLEESELNEESYISLMESFPVYIKLLEPLRLELNAEGLTLLDDNLVTIYDLYTDTK